MGLVEKIDVQTEYLTDHNSVEMELNLNTCRKGRGFWKFNSVLLKDSDYNKKVKQMIEVKNKYASLPFSRDTISTLPTKDLQFTISDQLFF